MASVYYSDSLVRFPSVFLKICSDSLVLRGARAPNAAVVGLERAPAKKSAPRTLVDVETPLIISVLSASIVA